MMKMTQSSRKRLRSMEDESSEFTPLSKRINNLHLNGWSSGLREPTTNNPTPVGDFEWNDKNGTSSSNSEPSPSSSSCEGYSNSSQNDYTIDYRPELGLNDNPYYYENNKLLYSLYVERMHRRSTFNNL